ncbi:angiopoietin-related protein 2 [Salmo salar]|uniref:Angiopoietin-related protein 2 n=1 Tax=Salmo salar TaxID=8030 RepID=A0A1S3S4W1_SALSA|nr:angiopoietin-related protein 2 [Salmo salar]|eukprot:XP_014059402.1 PREDICTED: angiopoietin-related protein 2-like [Salmo salar]
MEKQLTIGLSLLLGLLLVMPEVGGRKEESQKRPSRFSELKAGRCSYTFIVPQQQLKGALCVSTESTTGAANHSEVTALRGELSRQQEQLEKLRGQLEQEGALVTEVRALRKESGSMNSRIAQIYAQLLHEVMYKKDQVVEQRRVENLLLNATTQMLQISTSYRELEKKYGALTSMMSNQSQLIARLEKLCQATKNTTPPPQMTSEPLSIQSSGPLNDSSQSKEMANDVQRDQGAPPLQPHVEREPLQGTKVLPTTMADTPTDAPFISFPVTKTPGPWRDCQHALDSGETTNGIYLLRPQSANRLLQAWCEQTKAQGGWTVIQRRQDGSVNFFRTWEQYKQGFGNLDGEYWLGLEHLYWLTKQAHYKLRVAMEDWQGRQVFAEYDSFRLEPESDWYRLRLGEYQGNAGDSMSWHNNKAFTTLDKDKDAYSGNCAHFQKGGWWYHMCAHSNLNGVWYRGGHYRSRYQDGVYWAEFHGGSYSLKTVTMMIKPT